jgi:iron-sulfur cluster repair protein YtfE (RIC family)
MLNQIRTTPRSSTSETALDMLVGCHERIRHFSSMARKLAHAHEADAQQVQSAAEAAHRYFTVALPLHEADENESLHPRLKRAVPVGDLAGPAADAMVDQHHAIDELLERLLPLLQLLERNPAKQPEVAGEMCSITSRLDELFREHLELEEKVVFPAISASLTEADRQSPVAEMQARRK